ncbi:MAG: class I SAM-dependent methyltransferase [Hydrogenophilaceae bacterium]
MLFQAAVIVLLLLIAALLLVQLRRGRQHDQAIADLPGNIEAGTRRLFAQIEAYLSLRDRLGLRQGLPYSHNWSAAADFLKLIVEHALVAKPATIVECSSGLTTLMLARCCEMNGRGEVFSLENGAEYAAGTRAEIARYGLEDRATVIDAPLTSRTLAGQEYRWYALDDLPDRSIDMLVIDGPPGFIQRHSRYPALPLLFDRLADGGVVYLDDAARPDERELVAMWLAQFPAFEHEYVGTERGCSILRLRRNRTRAA